MLGGPIPIRLKGRAMPEADKFPKIRRLVVKLLKEGLEPLGFSQFGSTAYFIRDRGPVRDAMFFQKMRSNAVTVAYGVSLLPVGEPWSPGLAHARWLDNQAFYNVKYEEHARSSIARAIAAFQREALPWFDRFTNATDVKSRAEPGTTTDQRGA
jgi:hypothetical protein